MSNSLGWIDAHLRGWHVVAAALAVVMAVVLLQGIALARIEALAVDKSFFGPDNPLLFDGRETGYTFEQAKAHLRALGPEARAYYAAYYYPIFDFLFPLAILAFGLLFVLWITRPGASLAVPLPAAWRLASLAFPLAFFAVDMGENVMVSRMLAFGDDPPRELVETASTVTTIKYAAAYLSATVALVLVALAVIAWMVRRPERSR